MEPKCFFIRKPRLYLTSVHCISNQYYNPFQFTIHVPFIVFSIFRDYSKHSWCWILPVFCGPNINWLLLVRCAETIQFQSTHWANFVKVASRSISKRQRLLYKCIYVSFCHVCIPTIISKWKTVISKRQQLSALFLCFPPSTCFPQSLKPRFTRIFLSFLRVSNFSTKLSGQLLLLCLPSKSILSSQLVLIFSKSILPRQAQLVLIWKLFKQIFEFQFFASKFTFETLFTWLFEQFLFLSKSFSILLQNWRFKHCLLPRQTS